MTQANAQVPIRVLLFAGLREAAGWSERTCQLPLASSDALSACEQGMTPRHLWSALAVPGDVDEVRIAINQSFATAETLLHPGDELAFLPPMSGG
jgi:sulfur-carrier protein